MFKESLAETDTGSCPSCVIQSKPGTTLLPVSATAHSSRWPSWIVLLVPCPLVLTSRIQTSGSRVWVRDSRETLPSPRGTNRPCAPVTDTNIYLFHTSYIIHEELLLEAKHYLGQHQCIVLLPSSLCCDDSLHSNDTKSWSLVLRCAHVVAKRSRHMNTLIAIQKRVVMHSAPCGRIENYNNKHFSQVKK